MSENTFKQSEGVFFQEELSAYTQATETRIESNTPFTVRIVQYSDGRQVLQGGYSWFQGFKSGTVWKDLPVVMVDANGLEYEKDVV